ncbi:NAD(P)-dependent oxidoreductase [Marivita hallyeonensis]|uniref:3-hydroxyisobutyrate dehydrogenase n=1 Tax=Marivita hallyeonensis TaxID=996342 RepID=A0A1M5MRY7_9RHOB|nr:NAD(P)-dependent oxidoreductase [Marivita hallyeonensis]SHG79822.1 3-hydroxyisobutyrate dehydrogenase [Marivita hallyeonensis]
MRVGFIGLGAVGAKLAGTLARNGVDLTVFDLDPARVALLTGQGAKAGEGPGQIMRACDVVVTSLPSPAASQAVLEQLLPEVAHGKTWIEMSTTDPEAIKQQAQSVIARGGQAADCPVSGGCHRAATGNISIFAGCDRATFETVLPILTIMGRRVLHTGDVGSASVLKVMTNYLATAHLATLCEAMTTMAAHGIDLGTTFEAIKASSGNSFVHETESQLILSGSRDVDFTLDLVLKDIGLFQKLADDKGIPLEMSPKLIEIVKDGQARYGDRAQSDRLIERLEEATGLSIRAPGFPLELVDDEPEERGHEIARGLSQ